MAFSSYLTGKRPNDYVIEKYKQGHLFRDFTPNSLFDKILISLASSHPLLARLADVYSRIFLPKSILREKLVLLMAILESSAPTYKYFDIAEASGRSSFFFRLIWFGLLFILTLPVAIIFLLPVQLLAYIAGRFSNNSSDN